MSARILEGNVFDVLPMLAPRSLDVVVTSPPYWRLRSYLPKNHALKPLELGSEPTPGRYVENLVRVFGLVRECLADHGTVWLNVGDTYAGAGQSRPQGGLAAASERADGRKRNAKQWANMNGEVEYANRPPSDTIAGSLCLIPQRLALALQDDGWLVRSVVVWHKPAPMPQSVAGWRWQRCRVKVGGDNGRRMVKVDATGGNHRAVASFKDDRSEAGKALSAEGRIEWSDCPGCPRCTPHGGYVLRRGSWRPTSSWEPVLMLAKQTGYYCDGIAVQTSFAEETVSHHDRYGHMPVSEDRPRNADRKDGGGVNQGGVGYGLTGGANLRDVWTIGSEPLSEAHYAAFPTELVHRCLKAATSARGYCPHCGCPWARVVEITPVGSYHDHSGDGVEYGLAQSGGRPRRLDGRKSEKHLPPYVAPRTLDWRPTCACPAHEPRPARVLDPFSGSGRTGVECLRLGLDYLGIELNEEYVRLSRRLLRETAPLFC